MEHGRPENLFAHAAHIGYLYRDEDECRRVLCTYVREGIAAGALVVCLADVTEDQIATARAKLGDAVDEAHAHQLTIVPLAHSYHAERHFDPDTILARLHEYAVRADAEALDGARVAGEMRWASRGIVGAEGLIQYERRINEVIASRPMTVLCEYDMRDFDGATCFAALGVHPMLLVGGRVIPNPYLHGRDSGLEPPEA